MHLGKIISASLTSSFSLYIVDAGQQTEWRYDVSEFAVSILLEPNADSMSSVKEVGRGAIYLNCGHAFAWSPCVFTNVICDDMNSNANADSWGFIVLSYP